MREKKKREKKAKLENAKENAKENVPAKRMTRGQAKAAALREAIFKEVSLFQEALKEDPLTARASDALGRAILGTISLILDAPSWRRYSQELKEEMRSSACVSAMRACKLVKLELGPQKVFSYFTRAIWVAFMNVAKKHYAHVNGHFRYIYDELLARGVSRAKAIELLGADPYESFSTGVVKETSKWRDGYKSEARRKAEAELAAAAQQEQDKKK